MYAQRIVGSSERFETESDSRVRQSTRDIRQVIHVVHFARKPLREYGSVETVFSVMRSMLPTGMAPEVRTCRFSSPNVFARLYNIFEAAMHQGEINHVTGDVHFLTLLMQRRKTVLTILDLVGLTRGSWWRRKVIEWVWYRLPIRRAAVTVAISEATRRQLIELLGDGAADIRVIPCCISPVFRPAPKRFREDYPTVLAVGTGPNKNLDRLIQAVAGIPCSLLIVGQLTMAQRDALHRHGIDYESQSDISPEEMFRVYERCDVLAFPSTYEGFGMPIVEAQVVERPVITSNVWSMPEVAGDGACLVDPFDVSSIRAGILRLIEDSSYRASIITAGRINRSRFSPDRIAGLYAEIYREVANAAAGGAP